MRRAKELLGKSDLERAEEKVKEQMAALGIEESSEEEIEPITPSNPFSMVQIPLKTFTSTLS